MKLIEINQNTIQEILKRHDKDGGNLINNSLTKLFNSLSDETNEYEVSIKVAALNQIYSTAIQYIDPVVKKIVSEIDSSHASYTFDQYVQKVDSISTVSWVNPSTKEKYTRCNLSFSSKYIHFLSNRKTPIYDSYIWIVMIGYLKQKNHAKYNFNPPESYAIFYEIFTLFKDLFGLGSYSNYDVDKFLWQYGKNMINEIINTEDVGLNKAKSVLKSRIRIA